MAETVFSKIINKELPADILYEDDVCLAFKDIQPVAPIHILIVPKKSIATLNDIDERDKNLIGHIHCIAVQIAKDIGVAEAGYRLVWNCNSDGGQEVFHIHMHLLAGEKLHCLGRCSQDQVKL